MATQPTNNKKTNGKPGQPNQVNPAGVADMSEDFSAELIRQLNKEAGEQIAYNLASNDAPTIVKHWISTGSKQLDYMISNRRDGGLPSGRIVEIQAMPGLGKSHLAAQICKSAQKMGGGAVYVDSENAMSVDNLELLGVDVRHRFVYVQNSCTEEIFKTIESAIVKSRSIKKDVPMVVVWDSVAQSSPQAELTGEYTDNTIGLQARVLGKGIRKIGNIIAQEKVLLVLINQQRMKIGVMYGNPCVSPDTKIRVRRHTEEELTFKELGQRLGITDFDTPHVYDIQDENYEILSFDHTTNKEVWKTLEAFVVKEGAENHYQVNTLHGTRDHKIFVDGQYVRLEDYIGAELVQQPIQVVDCQVADTHNYLAEGQINHNTTTPGGFAVGYASSVRLEITGGSKLEGPEKNKIHGITVTVKTIKNKISRPFRACAFEMHFGQGIVEHEQIFDVLRAYCETLPGHYIKHNGFRVAVEGTGAWKTFTVYDDKSGEQVVEEKFYKFDFGTKVLYNPLHKEYVDALMDAAYIVVGNSNQHPTVVGIDTSSNIEREALEHQQQEE